MTRISLVVATIGREEHLNRFLESLTLQRRLVDEIIVVDQNNDERLKKIMDLYPALPITRIKFPPRGANAARNFGLTCASGDIIGFPDDDCWYPEDVLYKVEHEFKSKKIDFLSGKILTEPGGVSGGRWQKESGIINFSNVWTTTIEAASFFDRVAIFGVGGFDVKLGPGSSSIYGAHEIDELCTRLLKSGCHGFYNPLILIGHDEPVGKYDIKTLNRAFRYGAGLGYVIKKHNYSSLVLFNFLIRSLGGAFVNLLKLRLGISSFYLSVFLGRLCGWLFYEFSQDKSGKIK